MKLVKIGPWLKSSEVIAKARSAYRYQPHSTSILDDVHKKKFTGKTFLQIALWKVNRYPMVTDELLAVANTLREKPTKKNAVAVLNLLLSDAYRGYDLPMASTVLRFAAPNQFQIIDQRVYRFITGKDRLIIPPNKDQKIALYFEYLKILKNKCREHGIEFCEADRVLYQLDKTYNKRFPIHKTKSDD